VEYHVFSPSGRPFQVNLAAAAYTYEWFNPSTGSISGKGTTTVPGGIRSFTPPFSGYGVLYLRKY
jgi:hypothetical protein